MNQKEREKIFADWLSAYADRLHMVRQGKGIDLARPDCSTKPPLPADKSTGGSSTKSKNA
jgi:hypothetical protein